MLIIDYKERNYEENSLFDIFESVYELIIFEGIGVALIEESRESITVDTDLESDC